jgi:hypothetical protein
MTMNYPPLRFVRYPGFGHYPDRFYVLLITLHPAFQSMVLRILINFRLKYSDRSRERLGSASSLPLELDKPKRVRDLLSPETAIIVHTPGPKPVYIGSISSIMIGMLFTAEEIRNYCLGEKTYMLTTTPKGSGLYYSSSHNVE